MPIRIYALAKELKIDSKDLVDICTKAGITGKGSALASLDDDEATKVKAYLAGAAAPAKKAAPAQRSVEAPERPAAPLKPTKPKVFTTKRSKPERQPEPALQVAPTAEPEVDEAPETVPPDVEPQEMAATVEPTEAVDASVEVEEEEVVTEPDVDTKPAPLKREDMMPSKRRGIKVIGASKTRKTDDGKSGDNKPKRRKPVINVKLPSMPEVQQPTGKPKSNEPKPQKPDIPLPQHAIDSHRQGKRPQLDKMPEVAKAGGTASPTADTAAGGRGKGRKGAGKFEDEQKKQGRGLAGMASARADRKSRKQRRSRGDDDDRRRARTWKRTGKDTAAPRKTNATLELPCTVRSFSEAASVSASRVLASLMKMGASGININAQIDEEFVDLLAEEIGVELEFKQPESLEDSMMAGFDSDDDPEDLLPRAPVVTFLGHVDHGKTSLLDYLIGIDVVSREAGGITQHIRAYRISKGDRKIAFVDTPGHEAFTEMRARGANVTDIAVLVVAADDGIMPQTEEAISHAKAAGVPIVVALNKIDLPGVDATKVMTQLTEYELTPSEWGGDVEVVKTSAISGEGMDELLDTLLTIADMHEYTANPKRAASGTCLEAEQEAGRGVIAKLIVENGTLNVGDIVVCGGTYGRVKAMFDTLKTTRRIKHAGPSTPVNVTGLDTPPGAGDAFFVLDDIAEARQIAGQRLDRSREMSLAGSTPRVSLEHFQNLLAEGRLGEPDQVVMLNLIIRADVRGSIEAIRKELGKLDHPEVQLKILQASVGAITAADVTLAHASEAVIIGFNVIPDEAARSLADERQVEIRRYDVIYKVTDDLRAMLEGKLKPEERVVELGHAIVKQVFPISRVGAIAGCYVARGSIQRDCRIRVNREGRTIGDYGLDSLRREKDNVKEVTRGLECGIKLIGFNDIKKDDVLEAYKIEEVARTLETAN